MPGVHDAVIHQMKWPSPSGPVEPHPERFASEMLPSPERATSDASPGEGVAETRAAEVTRARMVEKRMVGRVVGSGEGEWWVFDVGEGVWMTEEVWRGRRGFIRLTSPQGCARLASSNGQVSSSSSVLCVGCPGRYVHSVQF